MTSDPAARSVSKPHFNHVAMSLPADLLDEEHRMTSSTSTSTVFGFEELPMMTVDRTGSSSRCTRSNSSCSSSPTTRR